MTGPIDLFENHDIDGEIQLRESKKGNTWAMFTCKIPLFPAGDDVEEALDRILDSTEDEGGETADVDVEEQLEQLRETLDQLDGGEE